MRTTRWSAPLLPFVLLSAVAFTAVAAVTVAWSGHIATAEALGHATVTGRGIASGVVSPLVTPALRSGEPAALAALDAAVRARMSDGSIDRVNLWTPEHRLVYTSLGGDLTAPAPSRDVQVSVGFAGVDAQPLVLQAYLPAGPVQQDAHRLQRLLLPLTLGSVALLLGLLLPLAVALARRVERSRDERDRMLHACVRASDNERRRIAGDVHDTVIPDLVGLSYLLSGVAQDLPLDPAHEATRRCAEAAAAVLRRDVRALRGLITDLYPPELADGQLVPMVGLLLATGVDAGVVTRLDAPPVIDVPADTAVLVYRVVREALRNTVQHANASSVGVDLSLHGGMVTAAVTDNGVGMSAATEPGHLGLRLLADTVKDAGGTFAVSSGIGGGVRVTASLPVAC